MNRKELVHELRRRLNDDHGMQKHTLKELDHILGVFCSTVMDNVREGVTLVGFGKFYCATRKSRLDFNPRTREKTQTPEKTLPKFKPGKVFLDSVADRH